MIIIGVLAIISIALVLFVSKSDMLSKSKAEVTSLSSAQKNSLLVKTYVDRCLKDTLADGIVYTSSQGGYFVLPDEYYSSNISETSYYYYLGDKLVPSKEFVADEIAWYVDTMFPLCIDNFSALNGVSVTAFNDSFTEVSIEKSSVHAKMQYPLLVGEDKQITLNEFSVDQPARLNDLLVISDSLVNETVKEPKLINVDNILDLMEKYDVQVDTVEYPSDDVVMYTLVDSKILINGNPLALDFVTYYNGSNSEPDVSSSYGAAVAFVGDEFYMPITAYDSDYDSVTFYANTTLFDINEYTGEIVYVPVLADIGTHIIPITVSDGNHTTTKELTLYVRQYSNATE